MPSLILYHYKFSPFSEKMRLMLGYARLNWHSVIVKTAPPRPELAALVGGYRKIPVAQIGADVFCDSKAIASEIARLAGKPELAVEHCGEEVQAFVRHCELDIFVATFVSGGGGVLKVLLRESSLWETLRFIKDRIGIARKARLKPVRGEEAKALIAAHLTRMEALLAGRDFLFGPQAGAADFSAYLNLWTASTLCGQNWLAEHPRLTAWYGRMGAFGHGAPEAMSSEQALDAARNAAPEQPSAMLAAREVSIEPSDYARDATTGQLIAENEHAWVLRREHARVGTVHVHFPKSGYRLKPR